MTDTQIINRKILLKRQAVKVLRQEITELRFKSILIGMKADLEKQMTKDFQPTLLRKLDCVIYLLEN